MAPRERLPQWCLLAEHDVQRAVGLLWTCQSHRRSLLLAVDERVRAAVGGCCGMEGSVRLLPAVDVDGCGTWR